MMKIGYIQEADVIEAIFKKQQINDCCVRLLKYWDGYFQEALNKWRLFSRSPE